LKLLQTHPDNRYSKTRNLFRLSKFWYLDQVTYWTDLFPKTFPLQED